VGQAHLGFLKKANPDAPAKAKPIFEMQEDYTGAFNIQENVNEYGKSVKSIKNASGLGYVAVDKRIGDSQRSYESGTGSYQSEEIIDTPTNYMYKDLQVGSRPSSFSYTPRVKTSQDLLWSEGMISKTPGSTLRGGTLVNAASTCDGAQCAANCTDEGGLTNQTVSYMSERYSGIQSMNKTTQALGLNEMKTEASFQGTADYRTLVTAPNKTSIVDDEERYVGSYDIKRHTLATGTSKYDEPHLTVTSEVRTEERWYNNTEALIAVYDIHVTNDGNRALGPINVRDNFPPGTEYIISSIKPSSLSATKAEWTLVSLGIGSSIDIELELNVSSEKLERAWNDTVNRFYGSDLVNRVDAYGSYSTGIARGSSYAVVPVTWLGACSPELDIKKKAVLDSSDKTLVDYQIVLKNTANYPMAVTVTDYLPESMELVETAVTPDNYGPGRAQWVITTLPAGETITLDYIARALTDGQHVNRVKAEGVAITGEGTATSEAETSIYVSGTGSQPYTLRYGGWQPPAWELNTTVDGWYTSSPGVSVDEVA